MERSLRLARTCSTKTPRDDNPTVRWLAARRGVRAAHHGVQRTIACFEEEVMLQPIASSVVVLHRSLKFRAAPASVAKMQQLCDELKMQFLVGNVTDFSVNEQEQLQQIKVSGGDGVTRQVPLDDLLVFFGLSPKLGALGDWGLELNRQQIKRQLLPLRGRPDRLPVTYQPVAAYERSAEK